MASASGIRRNFFFDALKTAAILLVIVTHLNMLSNGVARRMILYFVVNQAVPLFMMISGFLLAASYSKSCCDGGMPVGRWYMKRILRLLPCCLIVLLTEAFFFKGEKPLGVFLLQGGDGPGAYYISCFFQAVILFPLLFSLDGPASAIVLNIAYEIFVRLVGMSSSLYSLLCFRYLVFIAIGIWLFRRQSFRCGMGAIPVALAGCTWLLAQVLGFVKDDGYWLCTNILDALYIGPVFCFLFSRFSTVSAGGFIGAVVGAVGKSTWHIFLIQKVGFELLWHVKPVFLRSAGVRAVVLPMAFVGIGVLFFMAEQFISSRLSRFAVKGGTRSALL